MSEGLVKFLNERAVAEALGVSVATVRRWRLFRVGPRYLKIGSSVRYRPDDVTGWLESCPVGGQLLAGVSK